MTDILKTYTEHFMNFTKRIATDIFSGKQYFARFRLVKAKQQLDNRCFSGSVNSYKSDFFTAADLEIQVFQSIFFIAGILKIYITEFYLRINWDRFFSIIFYYIFIFQKVNITNNVRNGNFNLAGDIVNNISEILTRSLCQSGIQRKRTNCHAAKQNRANR